jgi:hypothetical protein
MKAPGSAEGAARARTRPVLRRLSLSLVALAFAAFAASALAGSHAARGAFQINASITNADPVSSGRYQTTTRHQCGDGSASGALFPGGFHYDVYHFEAIRGWYETGQPSGAPMCVNVGLRVHSGAAAATGYSDTFNPSNPSSGRFEGSVGGLGTGQAGDFSYYVGGPLGVLPPHAFDVVVSETIVNGGATYTLLVGGTGIIMVGGTPTAAAALQSFRASSAPNGVLVRWKTRSEHEALGFNVYRGDKKKVRLTRSIVRASGGGHGHSYSFLDRSARKGKAAPYYLEVVQRSGSRIMFGPARTGSG